MKRFITLATATAFAVYVGTPSIAFAQTCSNGTEAEAQQFALDSCDNGRWQDAGYTSFDQCYQRSGEIYYSSVNDPGCGTGGGGGQNPGDINPGPVGGGGGGGGGGGCTGTRLCSGR